MGVYRLAPEADHFSNTVGGINKHNENDDDKCFSAGFDGCAGHGMDGMDRVMK